MVSWERDVEAFICFQLIKFKGNSPEEENLQLQTALRPLLLSLRSIMRRPTASMETDCHHGVSNTLGEKYDKEKHYIMGVEGPENPPWDTQLSSETCDSPGTSLNLKPLMLI